MGVERALSFGADPEIVITSVDPFSNEGLSKYTTDLCTVPVCGLVGGDKGAPVASSEGIGGWLEDGAMLELNPLSTNNPFTLNNRVQRLIVEVAQILAPKKRYLYYPAADAVYSKEDLEKHPKASVFGCAQDFCAYQPGMARENVMGEALAQNPYMRFAGGHLHLGLDPWPEELPKYIAVKFLDLFLGAPTLICFEPPRSTRAKYYGRAGLYRETSYGIEYRTPDNLWMAQWDHPSILMRFASLGYIFKNIELYKDALVDLYNKVDWAGFEEAFNAQNSGGVWEFLQPHFPQDPRDGFRKFYLGEETRHYLTMDHMGSKTELSYSIFPMREPAYNPRAVLEHLSNPVKKGKTTAKMKEMWNTSTSTLTANKIIFNADAFNREQDLLLRQAEMNRLIEEAAAQRINPPIVGENVLIQNDEEPNQ